MKCYYCNFWSLHQSRQTHHFIQFFCFCSSALCFREGSEKKHPNSLHAVYCSSHYGSMHTASTCEDIQSLTDLLCLVTVAQLWLGIVYNQRRRLTHSQLVLHIVRPSWGLFSCHARNVMSKLRGNFCPVPIWTYGPLHTVMRPENAREQENIFKSHICTIYVSLSNSKNPYLLQGCSSPAGPDL